MMLTLPEIKLLQFTESKRIARLKLEEEKREERLLLAQSLQSSMLTGMQLVRYHFTDFVLETIVLEQFIVLHFICAALFVAVEIRREERRG